MKKIILAILIIVVFIIIVTTILIIVNIDKIKGVAAKAGKEYQELSYIKNLLTKETGFKKINVFRITHIGNSNIKKNNLIISIYDYEDYYTGDLEDMARKIIILAYDNYSKEKEIEYVCVKFFTQTNKDSTVGSIFKHLASHDFEMSKEEIEKCIKKSNK